MNLWDKFVNLFFPCLTKKPERARYMDGRLKADDKKTPTINEAWKGGKAPAKKRGRPPKAKKRGRPPKKK
jgi:hypothetical protein